MQYILAIIILIAVFILNMPQKENKEHMCGKRKEKFEPTSQIYQKFKPAPFTNDRTEYVSGDDLRQEMIDNSHTKKFDASGLSRYRNDFFDFRNHTQLNSNQNDTVDKINILSEYGNGDMTKSLQGMSIREVYNQLTASFYH